jgi:hypothetical protein
MPSRYPPQALVSSASTPATLYAESPPASAMVPLSAMRQQWPARIEFRRHVAGHVTTRLPDRSRVVGG